MTTILFFWKKNLMLTANHYNNNNVMSFVKINYILYWKKEDGDNWPASKTRFCWIHRCIKCWLFSAERQMTCGVTCLENQIYFKMWGVLNLVSLTIYVFRYITNNCSVCGFPKNREGGVLTKVKNGEAPPPRSNPLPFIYHFGRKGTPFIYLLWKKGNPFTNLL